MSEMIPSPTFVEEDGFAIAKFNNNGNDYLHFTFKDRFTTHASKVATKEWNECCRRDPNRQYIHIWDCQGMTGFDKEAKDLWLEHMKKLDDQTRKIILVSDNIVIRGAARLMSKVSNFRLEVYKNYGDIIME